MLSTAARVQANWFGITRSDKIARVTLRELRIAKGFDRAKDFALAIGINTTTYSMIESGYGAGKENQKLIADALDLPIEQIFPSREKKKPVEIRIIHEPVDKVEAYLKAKYGNKLITRSVLN